MHANEGRPFFIIITGTIHFKNGYSEDEEVEMLGEFFWALRRNIKNGIAETVYEDQTGGVYEIPKGLVSIASKSYLLLGCGRRSISIIFVVQDLLYPFNTKSENIKKEMDRSMRFLEGIIKRALPGKFRSKVMLNVVDVRVLDAPFSLRDVEFIFGN